MRSELLALIALAVTIGYFPGLQVHSMKTHELTDYEIELIAQLTFAEAGNQSELGQRYVIDTVLNRVDHKLFPSTVKGVIFADNQFATAPFLGSQPVKEEIVELVKEELIFRQNYEVTYFNCGGYCSWGEPLFQEGAHYFAKCRRY